MSARLFRYVGILIGIGGAAAGALLIWTRYQAYLESIRRQRGIFAPLMWQVSLGSGTLIILSSLLIGILFYAQGRTMARLARLESAERPPVM